MKIKKLFAIILIIFILIIIKIFLFDNFGFGGKNVILWTDNPDFISYTEMFNSQHNIKIETIYKEKPALEILKAKKYPDIVIGSYLNSPQIIDNFEKINHLFRNNKIDKSSFYKLLLEKGAKGSKQLAIPVSFNMPAIMFRRGEVTHDISSFVINYANIEEISSKFNKNNNKNILAFSPRWNSDLLYYSTVMNNADFKINNKKITYSITAIQESLNTVRTFIKNINGGIEKDKIFEEKHLYKPGENLINEQRIFFAYTDLKDFYAIGLQKRNELNFRWLSSKNNKIPVCDDVVYAAIPKHGSNRRGAEIFAIWFFNYNTQESIMESGSEKRIRTFGIANGFSSIRSVNEQIFPKHYPLLVGHIPPNDMLNFPSQLPVEWEDLKNNVIKKWLYTESGNESTVSDLDNAINDWYKTHPGF